jgi:CubicO group peptidase (beta-lactamase class C family)
MQGLQEVALTEMRDKAFPSFAIVVVDRDRVLAEVVVGQRVPGLGEPAGPEDLYRTGSVGKTITDLAVMAAVEAGQLDLDADIRSYLPGFAPINPGESPITLRLLMTHESGLVREPPVGNYFDDSGPSLQETVESLNGTSLVWEPGSRTKYSNAGLAVVGRVLEVVNDQPFPELIDSVVFRPAGMTTARVGLAGIPPETLVSGVMWQPDGTQWDAPIFDFGMSPAGDFYASSRDMAALMRTLLSRDGRIVSGSTLDRMWSPASGPPREEWQLDVGLGFSLNGRWDRQHKMARHGGAVYGFSSELALLPEESLGVFAVAGKSTSGGSVRAVAHWALRAALADREGRGPPPYELTERPFEDLLEERNACSLDSENPQWAHLVGWYGWDHNPLLICEKDGILHALIEWFYLYPLDEAGESSFAFPSWALYGQEVIRFVGDGERAEAAVVGHGSTGVRFPRREGQGERMPLPIPR